MTRLPIVLLFVLACSSASPALEPMREEAPSSGTRWVHAEAVQGLGLLEAPARVLASPDGSAVVTAPAGARVLRVRVRPGEGVKEGDPLVDVLVPDVVHAAGALSSANLRLGAAEARRARLAPLVEQGLSRASELAELDATIATTRAEAQTARATLRAAGVSDQRASTLLAADGSIALRSPLTGMITAVDARSGEVREPAAGPLVEIAAPSVVQIEARMMATPPAGVQFEWLSTLGQLPITLRAISPRANAEDGSKLAWFDLPAESTALPAGAVGRVRTVSKPGWVMVPIRALFLADGKTSVVVLSGEGTAQMPVHVVMQNGSEAVVEGLKAGARVAADASLATGTGTTP